MRIENDDIKNESFKGEEKINMKDFVAMLIAVFQVFYPIIVGAVVAFTLIMLFITKIWLEI